MPTLLYALVNNNSDCITCSLEATAHQSASLNSILKRISLIYAGPMTSKWHKLGQKRATEITSCGRSLHFRSDCELTNETEVDASLAERRAARLPNVGADGEDAVLERLW